MGSIASSLSRTRTESENGHSSDDGRVSLRDASQLRVSRRSGFTLAEILLAFALLATTILTLVALSFYAYKAGKKSSNKTEASQIAVSLLSSVSHSAASDPAFWSADHLSTPYRSGTRKVGKTEYEFEVFSETLINETNGDPLGGADNRIKKIDVVVKWFGDSNKEGFGKRSIRNSCLANEDL